MTVFSSPITTPTMPRVVRVATCHGEELFPNLHIMRDDRSERDVRVERANRCPLITAGDRPAPTVREHLQAGRRRPVDEPMAERRGLFSWRIHLIAAVIAAVTVGVGLAFLFAHFYR